MAVPLSQAAQEAVIDLAEAVRAEVEAAAHGPRSAVRWVRMDGLHLTLRFLGPTDPQDVAAVEAAVRRAGARALPFSLVIGGAGAFPSAARPRTIWLGLTGGLEHVAQLASTVDDELESVGWTRETRPFRGHLTLARADGRREGPLVARRLADRMAGRTIASEVSQVALYESVTGSGAARYVSLASVPLGR